MVNVSYNTWNTHNWLSGAAVVNQTITTSSTYDEAGKVLTSTDPLNHTTQTVYDQYARPYKTIFADGSFVEMGYDSRGRKAWEREQRFANCPRLFSDRTCYRI